MWRLSLKEVACLCAALYQHSCGQAIAGWMRRVHHAWGVRHVRASHFKDKGRFEALLQGIMFMLRYANTPGSQLDCSSYSFIWTEIGAGAFAFGHPALADFAVASGCFRPMRLRGMVSLARRWCKVWQVCFLFLCARACVCVCMLLCAYASVCVCACVPVSLSLFLSLSLSFSFSLSLYLDFSRLSV